MLFDGILDIIGFTDEMKRQYNKYKALTNDRIDALALGIFLFDGENIIK